MQDDEQAIRELEPGARGVYCGAIGATRFRQALPGALVADLAGYLVAVVVTLAIFGR